MTAQPIDRSQFESSAMLDVATVTRVEHLTDRLFGFAVSRPASFRFRSGEFVMVGLPNGGKPLLRAYSIASPSYADELEFLSNLLLIASPSIAPCATAASRPISVVASILCSTLKLP